jgi:hypothetical protein
LRLRQAPIDVDRLLHFGQRFLVALELGENEANVAQAHREIGLEACGRPLGESPSDVDGLLRCGQRLLLPAEIRKAKAQVA